MIAIAGGVGLIGAPDTAENLPGSPPAPWMESARPEHRVRIQPFEIGKYEVTAAEFCAFLNEIKAAGEDWRPYVCLDEGATIALREKGFESLTKAYALAPALHVQYRGAERYCEWLSKKNGRVYRLPTEAEWEFAARGAEGRSYPWGEASPEGRAFLSVHYALVAPHQLPGVCTVGMFPEGATPEGIQDMIGNAAEWCCGSPVNYAESLSNDLAVQLPGQAVAEATKSGERDGSTSTVYRGAQYVDLQHATQVPTAWTRFEGPPPDQYTVHGVSVRLACSP